MVSSLTRAAYSVEPVRLVPILQPCEPGPKETAKTKMSAPKIR
jgi:hypothetical protein